MRRYDELESLRSRAHRCGASMSSSSALRARPPARTLKLKGLVKGSYTAAITAENPNGKSRTVKLKFTITHK